MSRGADVVDVWWVCALVLVLTLVVVFGAVDDCGWTGVDVLRTSTSTVAPVLSSSVRIVRRGTSVLATITPTTQTKRIGWFW